MLDGVFDGLWPAMAERPWLAAVAALLVVGGCVRTGRALIHGLRPIDSLRAFSPAEKRVILARAGHRCEHHHVLYGRCEQRDGLQADHVHPHSRGGWTNSQNGQALCARHNKSKSARVPWNWELRRLARRRENYFPSGAPPSVIRHRPRSSGGSRRQNLSRVDP
jgi:hypothetical protein